MESKKTLSNSEILEKLVENSSLGYHSVDKNGMILRVNNVWLSTLGYGENEVIGRHLSEFIHPDFIDKFKNNFPRLMAVGLIKDFTFMMRKKDGSPVELIFNGAAIHDDDGNFLRTVASFHLPDQPAAAAYAEPEKSLISRSRAELMQEMMSAVAHQWRQPLNALGLIVQDTFEITQLAGFDDPEIKSNTDTAINLVLKMSGIIDEFRDFFTSSEKLTKVNLAQTVMQCLKIMMSQLQEDNIDFSVICECSKDYFSSFNETIDTPCKGHNSFILANENELKQMIINVISNARYAMMQAMERRMISKGQLKIHIKHKCNHVEMTVANNGMRIPDKAMERIFTPYFSTKMEGEGLGLGLYFSRQLIEKHMSGHIDISNIDSGVIVRVTLPVQHRTAE